MIFLAAILYPYHMDLQFRPRLHSIPDQSLKIQVFSVINTLLNICFPLISIVAKKIKLCLTNFIRKVHIICTIFERNVIRLRLIVITIPSFHFTTNGYHNVLEYRTILPLCVLCRRESCGRCLILWWLFCCITKGSMNITGASIFIVISCTNICLPPPSTYLAAISVLALADLNLSY